MSASGQRLKDCNKRLTPLHVLKDILVAPDFVVVDYLRRLELEVHAVWQAERAVLPVVVGLQGLACHL